MVCGEVNHSILFPGVFIGEGAKINDSVIMPNVKIGANVRIEKAIIGVEAVIEDKCQIGCLDEECSWCSVPCSRITVVEGNIVVRSGSVLKSCSLEKNQLSALALVKG
ncbi:hypothetical protein P378_01670 [Desulforamulus profundi]|uniref:Glucose-1-phosphate adenylyltransferase/Bifunctional protein GlmU-like C-terminal hexapeptide domain-containing protein n=1 Tax=Desulforamulus profundi TaxID=1383067 RepID=A0A2C6LM71_9FIRM|nr:hypothetical protein P378_01670 [Desulforamulus profundi]